MFNIITQKMALLRHTGRSNSQSNFVFIDASGKTERIPSWKNLRDQYSRRLSYQKKPEQADRYQDKKSILANLPTQTQSQSTFRIKEGFNLTLSKKSLSFAEKKTSQEKCPTTSKLVKAGYQNGQLAKLLSAVNKKLILEVALSADERDKLIGIIFVKRHGLRYKLKHCVIQICGCSKSSHRHRQEILVAQIKQKINLPNSPSQINYFFHLNGSPINNIFRELQDKERTVIIDTSPKFDAPFSLKFAILQFSSQLQAALIEAERSRSSPKHLDVRIQYSNDLLVNPAEQIYDWHRIDNVRSYVDKIFQNPESKLKPPPQPQRQMSKWCNQRYKQGASYPQNDKNPLFESLSHYSQQALDHKMLHKASQLVEGILTTKNKHRIKVRPIQVMLQKVFREKGQVKVPQKQVANQYLNRKEALLELDRKNSSLATQNIPYLIEKYGISRFEIHSLYNLYKSFQKVSVMRNPGVIKNILKKGVDRQTFDEGLKGLDMNPGEELIRNICHFGDYISWEQFIKIVSISLRKTPQEKLQAILQGITGAQEGFLSKYQISVMIGSSLLKIFDSEESDLKAYFTDMAMKELSSEDGNVLTSILKEKVLGRGSDNLNMVSFLILNS